MNAPSGQVARTVLMGLLTASTTAAVTALLPPGNQLDSAWMLLASLVPFVLATETIAGLDPTWFRRWRLSALAGVANFALVFCILVPKVFDRVLADDFDGVYSLMRIMAPVVILTIGLQYRLGGGTSATVRRVAYASLLIMLSGIEDLMFSVWRGTPIPQLWDWADHMTVFLGHVASKPEAYAFITGHLLVAAAVLFWPQRRPPAAP